MKLRNKMVGVSVVVALSLGVGVTPALAQSTTKTAAFSVSSVASLERLVKGTSLSLAKPASSNSSFSLASTSNQQAGAIVRAFIAAVKAFGPALWKGLTKAVAAGYSAFVKWLSGIPGWIQAMVATLSTNALYDWLKSLLGL